MGDLKVLPGQPIILGSGAPRKPLSLESVAHMQLSDTTADIVQHKSVVDGPHNLKGSPTRVEVGGGWVGGVGCRASPA